MVRFIDWQPAEQVVAFMGQQYSLQQLAEYLGVGFEGDADVCVSGIASLQNATENDLAFLSKKQFEKLLLSTRAAIVVLKPDIQAPPHLGVLHHDDPYLAYARLSQLFVARQPALEGIHPTATVDPSCIIAKTAAIGPNCVLEAGVHIGDNSELQAGVFIGANSRIGDQCVIYANVAIYHGVTLGDRVTIHSGSVIGADGFGFAPAAQGWLKIHQLGGVSIGNDVEIGAGTAIDRGALDDTVIEGGVIIDNHVHIAHNVHVGERTAIAGCVGIAGSSTIGKNCTIGGFSGINGHLQIADNVHLHGATIVTKSITESGSYASCTPMQEVKKWRKNAVRFAQLDEWVERIKKLEQTGK